MLDNGNVCKKLDKMFGYTTKGPDIKKFVEYDTVFTSE